MALSPGTLLTGFLLTDWLDTAGTMQLLVVLAAPFLWMSSTLFENTGRVAVRVGGGLLLAFTLWAVPSNNELWPRLHGIPQDGALYAEDSTGVALLRREDNGSTVLFANGLGHSRVPYGELHTVLGALPAMMHPNPRRVAVIGLGSGDTTYALSGREETEHVASIEIIGAELSVLRLWAAAGAPPPVRSLLADRRNEFHIDDGRAFLLRAAGRFDIIEADALWPRTAYSGNLYSTEYFGLLRSRLATGGYAVSWLPTPRSHDSMIWSFPYRTRRRRDRDRKRFANRARSPRRSATAPAGVHESSLLAGRDRHRQGTEALSDRAAVVWTALNSTAGHCGI